MSNHFPAGDTQTSNYSRETYKWYLFWFGFWSPSNAICSLLELDWFTTKTNSHKPGKWWVLCNICVLLLKKGTIYEVPDCIISQHLQSSARQTDRQTGSGWWITNSDHKSYCRLMIRTRGAQGVILFFTLLTVCWSWAELAKTFFIIFTSKLYDELMLIFLFASVGCLQLHSWPLCCLKNKNYCRLSIDSVQRGKNKSQIWKSFELIWEI